MDAKTQQLVALANPCYAAEETSHPAFRWSDGVGWVILTLNSGFE